ncbi:MAG TPA: chemotaxis protein CheA, partial [Polyangiales bacterium]
MNGDEEIALLFVEEAVELLADAERALLLLESLPDDVELLSRIFRCAHTVKGNAKMLRFDAIASFTHLLENLLDKLRKQEQLVTEAVANTLLASFDFLKVLVSEVAGGAAHDPDTYAALEARIEAVTQPVELELPEPAGALAAMPNAPPLLVFEPHDVAPPEVVEVAAALPVAPAAAPIKAEPMKAEPMKAEPSKAEPSKAEPSKAELVKEAPIKVAPVESAPREAAPVKERRAPDGESSSVRVAIEKLDRLINLTGEVVIAQSMIAQLVTELTPQRVSALQELVAQMERHCRELQERMLGARMLPVKNVFGRFNRLVRDLSAESGKQILLEVFGEDTELDKTVIEGIADPLTHLIRNAIDHGIEAPHERRERGKPEQARLKLSAYQKGGSIFVEVSDDGRGLDRARILAKALSTGLVRPEQRLSDEEVHALIFAAGFSTADKITEISGRGVGMDVVRRNVEALKGTIGIVTEPGRGTTFRIKLPLTLAILDGLALRVGTQIYLLPLVAVVESLKVRERDVRSVPDAGEVIDVRGEILTLLRLHEMF